jgi:hypothetical protein
VGATLAEKFVLIRNRDTNLGVAQWSPHRPPEELGFRSPPEGNFFKRGLGRYTTVAFIFNVCRHENGLKTGLCVKSAWVFVL